MTASGIILLTMVSSLVACGDAAPTVVNNELTLSQFEGEWFEIGQISDCSSAKLSSCYTHTILKSDNTDNDFYEFVTLYENIPNCDRGIPKHSDEFTQYHVDSTIHINGNTFFTSANFTIESYNYGKELIFTEWGDELCSGTSYKLWSREREVSAGTKAEFEKIARNNTVAYYSYDSCPKVCGEVDEHSVDVEFEGLWYEIARIYSGDIDNVTCGIHNITVNYENNAFTQVFNAMKNGRPLETIQGGKLIESGNVMSFRIYEFRYDFYGIRCNGGEDLILVQKNDDKIALMSRSASAETITRFKKIADMLIKNDPHTLYTIIPHDNCAKMNE